MSRQLIDEREALVAAFESSRVAAKEADDLASVARRAVRDFDAEHLAEIQEFEQAQAATGPA